MNRKSEYSALAPYYDLFIDWDRRLALEMPFILETLPDNMSNLRCLDIGCGTGRHLERLSQAGLLVAGCEPSPGLRAQAERNLPGAAVYPQSMEQLGELAGQHGPWDLVLCLGNTLAHLPPENHSGFFKALATAVAPGGNAILHLLGYDRIMRLRPGNLNEKTVEYQKSSYVFRRKYVYLDTHIVFTIEIEIDGRPVGEQTETLFPLGGDLLEKHLESVGFTKIKMFGGFDGNRKYTAESENLVCVVSR